MSCPLGGGFGHAWATRNAFSPLANSHHLHHHAKGLQQPQEEEGGKDASNAIARLKKAFSLAAVGSLENLGLEEAVRLRTELVEGIAAAVVELDRVNLRLDALAAEAAAATAAAEPERPPSPQPLTPEHRRLLRFKSYSYPFLSEDSWYSAGAAAGDEFGGGGGGANYLEWQDSEDEGDAGGGGNLTEFEMVGAKLAWTDFLKLQETCIGDAAGAGAEEIL